MILLKDMSIKNLALTFFGFISALFSILSLVFKIITFDYGPGISGFKWLFGDGYGSGWDISGFASFLTLVVFVFAIGIIGLFCATFLLAGDKTTYRKGMRLVTVANLVSALVYMIAGFVAKGVYRDEYFGTAAFIPFILAIVFTLGYFASDKVLGE